MDPKANETIRMHTDAALAAKMAHDCRREVADIHGALWFTDAGMGPSEPTITVRASVVVGDARVEVQSRGIGGYLMDPLTARQLGGALIKAAADAEHYARQGGLTD
jgi:hypothetical protein